MCIVADTSGKEMSKARSLIVTGRHLADNGIVLDGDDDKRASLRACERAALTAFVDVIGGETIFSRHHSPSLMRRKIYYLLP